MARARNYRAPHMVVRQRFVNDGGAAAVTAAVHISGPHANFISRGTDSFERGFLGSYSDESGLAARFPTVLRNNVLDTSSVEVVLRDAALRYFSSASEPFIIPANSRNTLAAASSLQALNFSFCEYGFTPRYSGFHERDVRSGDLVRLTAAIGGQTKSFWTSVAKLVPRFAPGEVDASVGTSVNNAESAVAGSVTVVSNDTGFSGQLTASPTVWSEVLLAKGTATAVYTAQVILGGDESSVRFRVIASNGDNAGSVALVESGGNYSLPLGTLGVAFDFDTPSGGFAFVAGTSFALRLVATYTPVTVVASGDYTAKATEQAPKVTTYVVTVIKGGFVASTAPADDMERFTRPILVATTNTGTDSAPFVRVEQANVPVAIGRYGVQLTVPEGNLIEGDKFYITAKSSYSDIVPYLNLTDNLPKDWVSPIDTPVTIELFISKPETMVPGLSMSASGAVDNWFLEIESVRIRPNLTLSDPSWTVNGEADYLPVIARPDGKTKAYFIIVIMKYQPQELEIVSAVLWIYS